MNAPYPTARVIALYTLLTPMLFGFGVGLPLGVLMLPVVLASLLCGFLPALAVGATLWLDKSVAQSDWLVWVALWGWAAAMIATWCFLPAPLVAPAAEEGRDETA